MLAGIMRSKSGNITASMVTLHQLTTRSTTIVFYKHIKTTLCYNYCSFFFLLLLFLPRGKRFYLESEGSFTLFSAVKSIERTCAACVKKIRNQDN